MIDQLLFPIHLASTAVMTGVIWFVQLIHYPWFHDVPADRFTAYHAKYTRAVGMIVGPAMTIEFATALALLFFSDASLRLMYATGLGLLIVIWLSTALLQVPCHTRLAGGYDERIHRKLVSTNWIRTAGWSARLVLLLYLSLG